MDLSGFGRGRGLWFNSSLPTVGGLREGRPVTSTPNVRPSEQYTSYVGQDVGSIPVDVLGDLVERIGTSIGENIVSCLKSISANDASVAHSASPDLSRVNLTVSHPSYEPHPFRGDNTDRVSISEWEETVKVYLGRRGIGLCEQAEEVLGKLRGRASDVVRVGLRNKPTLNLQSGPQAIFDILKQHFSDSVTSFMPLADFYDTKPSYTETAVDYWIRLNKAIDAAVEGLKRQDKTLDNPSREVTVMFITHCPDPELSLVFSCKPLEEWTAIDVQVRLDEHHRKKRLQQRRPTHPISGLESDQAVDVLHSHVQTAVRPPAPQPTAAGRPVSSDGQSLGHVITLLERLLNQGPAQRSRPPRPGYVSRTRFRGPCVICGGDDHDTMSHCRRERLCFRCHAAGHQAVTCSVIPGPDSPAVQSGAPAQQGN